MTWLSAVLFGMGAFGLVTGFIHAWHGRDDVSHANTMEAIGLWIVACLLLLVAK